MKEKEYYNIRKGHIEKDEILSFEMFTKAFGLVYRQMEKDGMFQKYFGIECTDGFIEGELGDDIETAIFLKAGKIDLWPVSKKLKNYTESDLYTIIEILYDSASKPIETTWHDWNSCGIHVNKSDDALGRNEFRTRVNPILRRFKNVEISEHGEILESIEDGFEGLFTAPIPTDGEGSIQEKVTSAKTKFRRVSSTIDERRDALRDLADVLEYLKPKIQRSEFMNKDTNELFEIANTFGIRHHNIRQKTEYDKAIWHSWIFYCYLATIHVCLRLISSDKIK